MHSKAFLQQVYYNLQKTGRRNKHYEQYSAKLKAELTNSYIRRTNKCDSNEWQFRVMNSKLHHLADKARNTENSMAATYSLNNENNITELRNSL